MSQEVETIVKGGREAQSKSAGPCGSPDQAGPRHVPTCLRAVKQTPILSMQLLFCFLSLCFLTHASEPSAEEDQAMPSSVGVYSTGHGHACPRMSLLVLRERIEGREQEVQKEAVTSSWGSGWENLKERKEPLAPRGRSFPCPTPDPHRHAPNTGRTPTGFFCKKQLFAPKSRFL